MQLNGFTKLSCDIITSSVWVEDDATLRIWIGLLAMADADGVVAGTVPGLASLCRVTTEQLKAALEKFQSPDPDSRTKDNEGRRVEPIDGGWLLLNHAKYREKRDPEVRKAQVREAVARHRAKTKCNQNVINVIKVSPSKPKQKQKTEAEADTEKNNTPPNPLKRGGTQAFGEKDFEGMWEKYPNKDGKKEALKHFLASVKTEQDFSDISKALQNYKGCEKVRKGYIKNGSAWFNNWRDWINPPVAPPHNPTHEELEWSKKHGGFTSDF